MKELILFTIILFTVACQQKDEQVNKGTIKDDQSSVKLEPEKNCEFKDCENTEKAKPKNKEPMICTADVKECGDGSYVSRDHYNNCKFKECPPSSELKDKI